MNPIDSKKEKRRIPVMDYDDVYFFDPWEEEFQRDFSPPQPASEAVTSIAPAFLQSLGAEGSNCDRDAGSSLLEGPRKSESPAGNHDLYLATGLCGGARDDGSCNHLVAAPALNDIDIWDSGECGAEGDSRYTAAIRRAGETLDTLRRARVAGITLQTLRAGRPGSTNSA